MWIGVRTHSRTYGRVDSMSVICRLRTTLGRRGCTDWPVRPFDEYLWIHGMIWDDGVQRYNMVKEKANSTRIYDSEGYRRRAACICVRSDLEDEVSQQMAAPYIFAGVKPFVRSKLMFSLLPSFVIFFLREKSRALDQLDLTSLRPMSKSSGSARILFLIVAWIIGTIGYIQSETWQLDSTGWWCRTGGGTSGHGSSWGPRGSWRFRTIRPLPRHIWGYNPWCMPHKHWYYYVIFFFKLQ